MDRRRLRLLTRVEFALVCPTALCAELFMGSALKIWHHAVCFARLGTGEATRPRSPASGFVSRGGCRGHSPDHWLITRPRASRSRRRQLDVLGDGGAACCREFWTLANRRRPLMDFDFASFAVRRGRIGTIISLADSAVRYAAGKDSVWAFC